MEKSHMPFGIEKLLNIAAFGAMSLSSCNFVCKTEMEKTEMMKQIMKNESMDALYC